MIELKFNCANVDEAQAILSKVASMAGPPSPPEQASSAPAASRGRGRPPKTAPAEPAAAAAAPAPAKGPAKKTTVEDVRAALGKIVDTPGQGAVPARELLQKYAPTLSELKADDYAKVIADAEALLGTGAGTTAAEDDDFLK